MKPLDKNYLSLQFRDRIFSKKGTEFQTFFESIMNKKYPDFQTIKPYGKEGDGGNDGWVKSIGRYYQVYAPDEPVVKESDAADKLEIDFQKLKTTWNEISEIKEYRFVFNDKYTGSITLLEQKIKKLEIDNPDISFKLFLAKELESLFIELPEEDILSLGFTTDQRESIKIITKYLKNVEDEIDKESINLAYAILQKSKEIIQEKSDDSLNLEYEILEARCLRKMEKVLEAKSQFESLCVRYPNDIRPVLHLAEIYLQNKDYDKNLELLQTARTIDDNNQLILIYELVRKKNLNESLNLEEINEVSFPENISIKSNLYRVYSLFFADNGDLQKAESYIEKAIKLQPDRFIHHITKLELQETMIFAEKDLQEVLKKAEDFLKNIKKVEEKFSESGDIGARNKALLNQKKLNIFRLQEDFPEFERLSAETFGLLMTCYFDKLIEQILISLLMFAVSPDDDFSRLLKCIKNSDIPFSEQLLKVLILQFIMKGRLETDCEDFFNEINDKTFQDFISQLNNKNYKFVLDFIKNDVDFSVSLALYLKEHIDLKARIIQQLPSNIPKEKLELLMNFDKEDYDEAFKILKTMDLSKISYLECRPILKILQTKKAWDFESIVLKKLLEKEKNPKEVFSLKLHLFHDYFELKQYVEVISLGKELLSYPQANQYVDNTNFEIILSDTAIGYLERGKIDTASFKLAKELLEKYRLKNSSFEYKAGIEAEVYLQNNEPEKALESLVDGVKIKKNLSPEDYAKLNFVLSVRIGNQLKDLSLDSLNQVAENTFVKLKDNDQWYFIGDENELDTVKIRKTNEKYLFFIDKKLEDKIIFENQYSSQSPEGVIELIFPIERYILWKTVQNFHTLSKQGLLEGVWSIDVSKIEGSDEPIDLKNLLKFLEDANQKTDPLFETYCKNNIPLAVLAVTEGSLTNAIGRIQQEGKGYIHISSGTTEEFNKQIDVVKRILENQEKFYIDGTSALFLSESGLFSKVYNHFPNLKVPHSVINFLVDISSLFIFTPGQMGRMGYGQGRLSFSSLKKERSDLIRDNFIQTIKLLESNKANITIISSANKDESFSEKKVPPELSDACILAQKESIPILTDDFLYLSMNSLETKKPMPEYFSSLALIKMLYENGLLKFEEYLNYFEYLSNYRSRFLSLNSEELEIAVLGEGKIKIVKPENIGKFNFKFILSEEYGVPFPTAFRVVAMFFLKLLFDNTITVEYLNKIFIEIIETFPTKLSKKELGSIFLRICSNVVNKRNDNAVIYLPNKTIHLKLIQLHQLLEIFNSNDKLWITKVEIDS